MSKIKIERGLENLKKNLEISSLKKFIEEPPKTKQTPLQNTVSTQINAPSENKDKEKQKEKDKLSNNKKLIIAGVSILIITLGSIYFYKKFKKK